MLHVTWCGVEMNLHLAWLGVTDGIALQDELHTGRESINIQSTVRLQPLKS